MEISITIDDGNKKDLKVAGMLEDAGFTGTFYIAPYGENFSLKKSEVQHLAKNHEIGGHTFSHQTLTDINEQLAVKEIEQGKYYLENLIGREVVKFAYPRGWFNEGTKKLVSGCGFTEARTMKQGICSAEGYDKFEIPVTLHLHPDKLDRFPELLNHSIKQGYFGLVLHSWEIEKFNLWQELKNILKTLNENKNTKFF